MNFWKTAKNFFCIDAKTRRRYADSALAFEYKTLLISMKIIMVLFPAYGSILFLLDTHVNRMERIALAASFFYSLFSLLCLFYARRKPDRRHVHIIRLLYCTFTILFLYAIAAMIEETSYIIVYIVLICTSISFINPLEYKLLVVFTLIIPDLLLIYLGKQPYPASVYYILDTLVVAAGAMTINQFYAMDRYRLFALESRLRCDRDIDGLTSLSNKRYFQEKLEEHREAEGLSCAVLVDLDHFKEVNDTFGHERGDDVLREAAQILSNSFRSSDSLNRIGGDEFAAFFTADVSIGHMEEILRGKIRALFQKTPITVTQGDKTIAVTFSIGACIHHLGRDRSAQDILAQADASMYQIKHSTRNGACLQIGEAEPIYLYPQAEQSEKRAVKPFFFHFR